MGLQFGLGGSLISHAVRNYSDVCLSASYAEHLGFDFIQITDRTRDPYITGALCARATSRLQIWVGVANPYTRHPLVLANALALLDEIAPARVALIMGAGNITEMIPQMGYDPKGAYERVREAIRMIREGFKNADIDFQGEYFKAQGKRLALPAQHDIPIYVAANGPKMLEVGGELADGVITQYAAPTLLSKAMDHVHLGAERAGRSPRDVDVIWEGALVVNDEDRSLEGTLLTHAVNCVLFCPKRWLKAVGIEEETFDKYREGYVMGSHLDPSLEGEYAKKLKIEANIGQIRDLFTIAGEAESCISRIEELRKIGIKGVFAWIASPNPVEKRRIMEGISLKIMSAFRHG